MGTNFRDAKVAATALLAVLASVLNVAALAAPAPAAVTQTITRAITSQLPGAKVVTIETSPINGLFLVELDSGEIVYSASDGRHLVAGPMFSLSQSGLANVTDARKNGTRRGLLAQVKTSDMVVFSPQGQVRAVVNVFTDVDCGYCQKLHQEVPRLNEMGIEVRYLAYPRAGVGSDAFNKLVTAWCSNDRQSTLTRLKNRENVPSRSCANNPVAAQYELGGKMGVMGTPALVLADGSLVPGYMPAEELAKLLGVTTTASAPTAQAPRPPAPAG